MDVGGGPEYGSQYPPGRYLNRCAQCGSIEVSDSIVCSECGARLRKVELSPPALTEEIRMAWYGVASQEALMKAQADADRVIGLVSTKCIRAKSFLYDAWRNSPEVPRDTAWFRIPLCQRSVFALFVEVATREMRERRAASKGVTHQVARTASSHLVVTLDPGGGLPPPLRAKYHIDVLFRLGYLFGHAFEPEDAFRNWHEFPAV